MASIAVDVPLPQQLVSVESSFDDERLWPAHDAAVEWASTTARTQAEFDALVAGFEQGYADAIGVELASQWPPVEL